MAIFSLKKKIPITNYLLVMPSLVWYTFFLYVPLVVVVLFSFWTHVGTYNLPIYTLDNYILIFQKGVYSGIILYSLKLAFQVTLICFIIAFPVAYFLAMKIENEGVKTFLILIMLIPFWVDWTARTVAWYPVLSRQGVINALLLHTGLVSQPLELLHTEAAVTAAMVEAYVLFMICAIFLSMNKINVGYLHAAESLGASRARAFYEVVVKMSLPGVAIGFMFVFVMCLGDFATPALLGGTLQTIGRSIQYNLSYLIYTVASALATIMITIIFVIILVIMKLVNIKSIMF